MESYKPIQHKTNDKYTREDCVKHLEDIGRAITDMADSIIPDTFPYFLEGGIKISFALERHMPILEVSQQLIPCHKEILLPRRN
jgi:hypothetical protein